MGKQKKRTGYMAKNNNNVRISPLRTSNNPPLSTDHQAVIYFTSTLFYARM